ncbi:hypothetical protein D046_2336B, partial [Vibrio parahaemolyticus V-223/04]
HLSRICVPIRAFILFSFECE